MSSLVGEGDGNVTYGEMFTFQPFGNIMVTMMSTVAQTDTLLVQQFNGCGVQNANRILQGSAACTYSWSASAPGCNKVDPSTIMILGVVVDPNASDRVTVNSLLADGGDNFIVLKEGIDRLGGEVDTDALEKCLATHSPVAPGQQNPKLQVP
jgi:5'-nucleotidase